MQRRSTAIVKTDERTRLPAPQPLTHRAHGSVKIASCRLDALRAGVTHHLQTQISGFFTLTQHRVVSEWTHRWALASFLLLPHQESACASDASTNLRFYF